MFVPDPGHTIHRDTQRLCLGSHIKSTTLFTFKASIHEAGHSFTTAHPQPCCTQCLSLYKAHNSGEHDNKAEDPICKFPFLNIATNTVTCRAPSEYSSMISLVRLTDHSGASSVPVSALIKNMEYPVMMSFYNTERIQ